LVLLFWGVVKVSLELDWKKMADELFEVKTQFYLGNYQGAINEANQVKITNEEKKLEKSVYLYRSLIAQRKFGTVIGEISDNAAPSLRAVKILATYLQSPGNKREKSVTDIKNLLSSAFDPTVALIAGTIYYHEGNYDDALRALHNSPTLESLALQTQILLKIFRLDLAKKQLSVLKNQEDDATLTQLTEAWVNIAIGGEKYQEAFYIFQELAEKHSVTVKLLNGQAICHIHNGKYEDADDLLMEALERNNNDPETLVNLIVVGRQRQKSEEIINRYISQLREADPSHAFIREYDRAEALFNNNAKNYAPSKESS